MAKVSKPIKKGGKKEKKSDITQKKIMGKPRRELIETKIKKGARRSSFTYSFLMIVCLFLGIFHDPMYYWVILALGVFLVYWIWRGWFWKK